MTFSSRETSRSLGQPDTLYRFGYGTRIYGYTDAEQPITYDGVTYRPIPIERDAITTSGTLDKATLNVKLPVNTEIAELFRVFPPSDVVGITIFQGHGGDNEFLAMFVGRVLSGGRKGRIANLNCEPASTSMRRPGLRRRWQYSCPHVLYGPQCRANREDFTFSATIGSINRAFVTMVAGWNGPHAVEKFENGLFQWETAAGPELRNILQVNGNVLLVSGRLQGIGVGTTVTLSLGCAHNMDDCLGTFDNIHNYGGDPWIPTKNPIGQVNQFY